MKRSTKGYCQALARCGAPSVTVDSALMTAHADMTHLANLVVRAVLTGAPAPEVHALALAADRARETWAYLAAHSCPK